MVRLLSIALFVLTTSTATAQLTTEWGRLRQYGREIGVDSLCAQPDSACASRYFTDVVYGHTPRQMHYQGVLPLVDSVRIGRLTRQLLTGADWCPLLDSLETHDRRYRQLIAYCLRCLVDDYIGDSLTIEQVQETLNTYRWLNRFPATKRVIVNIPSATLRVTNGQGNTLLSSRVVVGKPSTPTPLFSAYIPSLVMYPYWNVPRSITVKELLPKIKRNPAAVLAAMKLQVVDAKGQLVDSKLINWHTPARAFPYRLRQSTGCDNALGVLKFNVNSPYDIYLHDTNARQAFVRDNRQLSHGCIRVEQPDALANLLLGYVRFKPNYLTVCPVNARPQTLGLHHPVPLFIVYNVLDIDENGSIQVYRNTYR
ncbi:L,D-transpeptidase family protein [Fibrella aquatilis]|uniref:L,D-transpeptidase family protein n=1 Tax=Fibrella aquatilis TaxID=2817059 RepID=A0A939JYW5_9BACT|nr:L,D-transpeptidase family protein [Fibrella aquatilis]MBO0930296.1 L,D-transpeptidase family protein [Fibrella aquatilis]